MDNSGWVTWCCTPPRDVGYQVYKFTVQESFDLGKQFIFAHKLEIASELILGRRFTEVVICLPNFTPCALVLNKRLLRQKIGSLGNWEVYYDQRRVLVDRGFVKGFTTVVPLAIVQ